MSKTTQVFWAAATSRTLAVWLLAVVTVMLAAGAVLPNPGLLSPEDADALRTRIPLIYELGLRYNSQEIAKSWAFGAIGVFLILSTTLCSIDRLIARYRRRGRGQTAAPSLPAGVLKKIFDNADAAALKAHAAAWLRKRRWSVTVTGGGAGTDVIGRRGRVGFWGSVFFHSILITALVGMVIYYLGGYRARLLFTEGQSYPLREGRFLSVQKRPVWGFSLPDVEIGLIRQYSLYSAEVPWIPEDYVARFGVTDMATGKFWEKDVRINDPLVIDGKEFLLVVGGYSPRMVIRKDDGAVVFDTYVALRKSQGTEDRFKPAGEELWIDARLYPDFVVKDDKPATSTLQLKNPFLHITVRRGARVMGEGLIPFHGELKAGAYSLVFDDMKRWVEMEMVGEPGIGFFFFVLFLGVGGIAARMLDPDEMFHISLRQDGRRVSMALTLISRHFPGIIVLKGEEFLRAMEEKVSAGGAM